MTSRKPIRVGALLDTVGSDAARLSVVHDARAAEAAGFDSVWASDHILMPTDLETPYPFTESGEIPWKLDDPWFDLMIVLTAAAVSTESVEIGTNVMIPALRRPLELAKQIATLDQLAHGRFTFGVGAGWLLEEFRALGIPTADRGTRLDEWIQLMETAWSGRVAPVRGRHFDLPRAVHMKPTPAHAIPLLIGGMSAAATRRVARLRAGWIAEVKSSDDPIATVDSGVKRIYDLAEKYGSPYIEPMRVVYNANESLDVLVPRLLPLVKAGVTDVVVSVDFTHSDAASNTLARIQGGLVTNRAVFD